MYNMLKHAHSGLRWLVLAFLVIAIIGALMNWMSKKPYSGSSTTMNKLALIFTHVQVVLGLALYFISPKVVMAGSSMKDSILRFFLVEHLVMMLIAAVVITIGHARQKRKTTDLAKHKTVFWFYLIGLIIILAGIPWPFQGYGASWF